MNYLKKSAYLGDLTASSATVQQFTENMTTQVTEKATKQAQFVNKKLSQSELPLEENVFSLIEKQASLTPDEIAIVFDENNQLTYQDVINKANSVCHYLKDKGVESETPIGILLHRDIALIPTLLGIWKAGGAYIPFDNEEPIDRLLTKLNVCAAQFMLIDREYHELFKENALPEETQLLIADEIGELDPNAVNQLTAPGGEQLAYYLFTSGSTGTPKAVEIEHRNIIALLYSSIIQLDFDSTDRYLASSTLAFDASVPELYLALTVGGSVLMRDRQIVLDPHRLAKDVRDHRVTMMATGPSVWALIISEVPDFPKVKKLSSQGEAIAPEIAAKLSQYAETPFNLYGPTETTVWATGQQLSPSLESKSVTSAPIGKPFPYVNILVVDDDLKTVPANVEGELLIGGPFVARGYTAREELTKERFVVIDGERYYRSGDVVLLDENGILQYFGRNDDQMQVKGVRIEPGEVETAILKDQRVSKAATTWYPTPSGTKAIVAAIVPASNAESLTADDIHLFVEKLLPRELLPSRFIFLETIPVTVNGKVDKNAIRALAIENQNAQSDVQTDTDLEALSETELRVINIWKKLLKTNNIGKQDHFFTLGGDSLAAVHLMLQTEREFGTELPRNIIFDFDRLDEFSREIERHIHSDETISSHPKLLQTIFKDGNETPIFSINFRLSHSDRKEWDWNIPSPLYALTTWIPGEGIVVAKSLQSLAELYIQNIKTVQPVGPYRLAGFSAGGNIALEIAQQLKSAGDEVEMLFLLDPMKPYGSHTNALHRRVKRKLSATRWLNYFHSKHLLRKPNSVFRKLTFHRNPLWQAFWLKNSHIFRKYKAQPYDGKTVLIVTSHINQLEDNKNSWGKLLPADSPSYEIDCKHFDLFDKNEPLAQWKELLSKNLRESTDSYSY